jgi:nitroreductase
MGKEDAMEVTEAIRSRRSIRRFKPDPVPREVLEELLDSCRFAPSVRNTQPWELLVLGGKVMADFRARLEENAKADVKPNLDIPAPEPPEPYLQRAIEQMNLNDAHQFPPGTENLDAKRAEYGLENRRFRDAPNGIIFYLEKALYPYAILDIGIIIQTVCLAAPAFGLGTCVMRGPVSWPDMVREMFGIPESKILVMAIAIGYPDPDALINSAPRPRLPLESFTHWHGF